MNEIIEKISLYWSYPFVRYAFIVAVLISVCASLLGVTLVLKRFSFIGDGLSHVAFGAMAVAAVAGLTNDMLIVLPVTVVCAIILLKNSGDARIKGDSAIAMVSVSAMAVGYLLMNIGGAGANVSGDVCTTLFGATSIITLTESRVWICTLLSVFVIAVFTLFYNKIFAITFDENFANATGAKTGIYNTVFATVTAVIIVLAMNLVGSLLVSALVVFPALSAMRICKSFKSVTVCAAIISGICSLLGLTVSLIANTPAGSTIVIADILAFAVSLVIGALKGKRA